MPLLRRFKLYFFGLFLGCVLVYGLFKGRFPSWLPGTIITEQLQANPLYYTKHALCRMDCRYITEDHVTYVLTNGGVNYSKSKVHDAPCPSYALEGDTEDGRYLRIVFAKCDSLTKVVTAIDLNKNHYCDCE